MYLFKVAQKTNSVIDITLVCQHSDIPEAPHAVFKHEQKNFSETLTLTRTQSSSGGEPNKKCSSQIFSYASARQTLITQEMQRRGEACRLGISERCQIPKIDDTDVKHDQFSRLEFFFPH